MGSGRGENDGKGPLALTKGIGMNIRESSKVGGRGSFLIQKFILQILELFEYGI